MMTALDQPDSTRPSASDDGSVVRMRVTGMTCAGCAHRVSEGLHKVPGVVEANVRSIPAT